MKLKKIIQLPSELTNLENRITRMYSNLQNQENFFYKHRQIIYTTAPTGTIIIILVIVIICLIKRRKTVPPVIRRRIEHRTNIPA